MSLLVPTLQPIKNQPRVDIDLVELRKTVFQRGQRVQWQQVVRCACNAQLSTTGTGALTGFTGEPDAPCPACSGRGYLYHSSQEITVQVTGAAEVPKVYELYGQQASGMVRITCMAENMPNLFDRFTLLDALDIYTERRKRTAQVQEQPRYPIVVQTITHGTVGGDAKVPATTAKGVIHCTYTDLNGDVVGGAIPTVLVEGTHFTVTAGGKIDWTLGIALGVVPAVGAFYALSYFHRPVYVAREFPYVNRETYNVQKTASPTLRMLPHRVDCWRENLGDHGETLG